MHFLVMSYCSHDFLLTLSYIYDNVIIMVVDYYSSITYEHLVLDSELSTCFMVNCKVTKCVIDNLTIQLT